MDADGAWDQRILEIEDGPSFRDLYVLFYLWISWRLLEGKRKV